LIEREVIKLPLPEGMGEGPQWKTYSPGRGRGGKKFSKKGKGRKPFNKKSKNKNQEKPQNL
ncbi:MAG: ATP-dependent helicase, partial [Tangfeifania sp.]